MNELVNEKVDLFEDTIIVFQDSDRNIYCDVAIVCKKSFGKLI